MVGGRDSQIDNRQRNKKLLAEAGTEGGRCAGGEGVRYSVQWVNQLLWDPELGASPAPHRTEGGCSCRQSRTR